MRPQKDQSSQPRLIDQQNRVALPSEVLAALKARAGDYVAFVLEGGQVRIVKVKWSLDQTP